MAPGQFNEASVARTHAQLLADAQGQRPQYLTRAQWRARRP